MMGNRAHCKGCYHYRQLDASGYKDKICHFAIDNNFLRDVPVEECPYHTKGKFRVGDSYNKPYAKQQMLMREKRRKGGKKGKRKKVEDGEQKE